MRVAEKDLIGKTLFWVRGIFSPIWCNIGRILRCCRMCYYTCNASNSSAADNRNREQKPTRILSGMHP